MSRRFTRILVPTDFGAASDAALMCAKELALRFDARLFLLHIVEDPSATGIWTADVYVAASPEVRTGPCPVLTIRRDRRIQVLSEALQAAEA